MRITYFGEEVHWGTNYDFQRIKRHLSNCLWLSYNELMASPHFKYSFLIPYNVTVFEWWYLPLCLELSLSCFSHNVFQGGCDCNWSGAGRRSRGRSRRRRKRRRRRRRKRRKRKRRRRKSTEAVAPQRWRQRRSSRAPASLASLAELENVATHKIFAMYVLNWSQIRILGLCIQVSETMSKN